jgi:penicillin-binding protein activator
MKKYTPVPFFSLLLLLSVFAFSCRNARQVQRVDPDTQIDLSGRWNDTDSRLMAEDLITQFKGMPWVEEFRTAKSRKPVLVVGLVRNKSHEHIDTETFIKDLEKSVIKTGTLSLVQAGDKRNELRSERADQQEFSSTETRKKWGKELGADFILQGTLKSIVDQYNKEQVTFYQVDLELVDMETNEIVWMGDKKIKKYIKD